MPRASDDGCDDGNMEVGVSDTHDVIVYHGIFGFLEAYGVALLGSKFMLEVILLVVLAIGCCCFCLAGLKCKDWFIEWGVQSDRGSEREREALLINQRCKPAQEADNVLNFSI